MTASTPADALPPEPRQLIVAGGGWSVERRGASNWCVIGPTGKCLNCFSTRRQALEVAKSQTTSRPRWM